MTCNAGLISARGPSAVAVHYYRNVYRKSLRIDLAEKEFVSGTGFDYAFELFKKIIAHWVQTMARRR